MSLRISIIVDTENNQSHVIETTHSETVYQLKDKLLELCGTDPIWQSLTLNGVELHDDYQLGFYEVKDGTRLNLTILPLIPCSGSVSTTAENSSSHSGQSVISTATSKDSSEVSSEISQKKM
ncbi:hypothetical protein FRX31_032358 [Thalictrum thalictroides]|uniref:Ubiquitin-like domain-containing protein n=1 Tax=Thalictrum thalictroides TaxID=46969 RepID=A0A7J6UZD9_THATH|nr:hypothetical protein FRX31_032358 [Thalictrum thalictroides]